MDGYTRRNSYSYRLWAVVISMVLVFSGCANKPNPRDFNGQIIAAPSINPDHDGRPSPVVIKIYQLKDIGGFREADFFSLYDEGPTLLGDDFISVEERELQPGVGYDYTVKVNPAVRYIAVIAAFRDIEKAQWRVVVELPEKGIFDFIRTRTLEVYVTNLTVLATFVKR